MTDREKVIRAVGSCFDYWLVQHEGLQPLEQEAVRQLKADAITMLKEQEAREPHYTTLRYLMNGIEVTTRHPECPRCIENGLWLWGAEIEKGQAYCKRCGQKVKWND